MNSTHAVALQLALKSVRVNSSGAADRGGGVARVGGGGICNSNAHPPGMGTAWGLLDHPFPSTHSI